jgi:signal transduction histidine kinase
MVQISVRLYQKISRILGIGAGVVVIVLLGLFYHFSSSAAERLLQIKMDATVKTTVSALSLPLWNLDYERVDVLLSQIMHDQDILEVRLTDIEGRFFKKTKKGYIVNDKEYKIVSGKSYANTHQHSAIDYSEMMLTVPVTYAETLGDEEKNLGELHIIYSNAVFVNSERRTMMTVAFIGVLLFSALIFFVSSFTKMALRPIEVLSTYLSQEGRGDEEWLLPQAKTYEIQRLLDALESKRKSARIHAQALERQIIEVNEARVQAEEAAKVKSDFLANMSHELRTPMHAILNFTKLCSRRVEKSDADEKILKYLSNIQTSGNRLLLLINNLLDLAKMEAGKMNYQFQHHDFISVIQQSQMELEVLYKAKRVKLKSVILTKDTSACFDDFRMIQVLVNILANALRYSPEGKTVTVMLTEPELIKTAGIPMLMCSIVDEGKGIPAKEHGAIFDKFVQSSDATYNKGGTGLGLSICRQIVEAHHGRIWVETPKNGGAQFNFTIPRYCNVIEEKPMPEKKKHDESGAV